MGVLYKHKLVKECLIKLNNLDNKCIIMLEGHAFEKNCRILNLKIFNHKKFKGKSNVKNFAKRICLLTGRFLSLKFNISEVELKAMLIV
jgi:hypothetical protein